MKSRKTTSSSIATHFPFVDPACAKNLLLIFLHSTEATPCHPTGNVILQLTANRGYQQSNFYAIDHHIPLLYHRRFLHSQPAYCMQASPYFDINH